MDDAGLGAGLGVGFFIIVLIVWLGFGWWGSSIMSKKGRSGCAGFALGALLGPIGLVIALLLSNDPEAAERQGLAQGEMRKCPQCAEVIRRDAVRCRFCGSDVPSMGSV